MISKSPVPKIRDGAFLYLNMAKLILISGISRSGKSTLAKRLSIDLPNTLVLPQDEFVLSKEQLPRIKDRIDWERPVSIDWVRLKKVLNESQSEYDFIILEGIFALSDISLASAADYSIQLKIDKQTFLERRKKETRWGTEPDWFLEHVWTSHLKFSNPHQVSPNLTMDNSWINNYDSILSEIELL